MPSSRSPTWSRACAQSPTPARICCWPRTPCVTSATSSRCFSKSSACWRPAACSPSRWRRTRATASSSARACATPMARSMSVARSSRRDWRSRIWNRRRHATKTTSPCKAWWSSPPKLESRRYLHAESLDARQFRCCGSRCSASKMLSIQGETQMKKHFTRREFAATAIATIAASTLPAPYLSAAEKKYDPGASDTEIKLGQTVPHSGPGSLYGVLGRVGEAYFQMINDKGGLNGRKIKFLTMDDAYSAPKCVEATRRLVEQEEVLALFGSLGTAPQTAVHKYLNSKGVPQLLLNTGASMWNDPKNNKWTMAGLPLYPTEARILAKHVLAVKPEAKVGILYQNDDFGRDFLGPFKKTLADAGGKDRKST